MTTRRGPQVILVLLILLLSLPAAALETTPKAILENPERFDGKTVTVRGTVTNLEATVSRKGNPYYTFDLAAGGSSIKVFSFGKPPCETGAAVTVDGRFQRVKKVSGRTFYNEVEVRQVVCR